MNFHNDVDLFSWEYATWQCKYQSFVLYWYSFRGKTSRTEIIISMVSAKENAYNSNKPTNTYWRGKELTLQAKTKQELPLWCQEWKLYSTTNGGSVHCVPWELEHSQGRKFGDNAQGCWWKPDYRLSIPVTTQAFGTKFGKLFFFLQRWWAWWMLPSTFFASLFNKGGKKWFKKVNVSQMNKHTLFCWFSNSHKMMGPQASLCELFPTELCMKVGDKKKKYFSSSQ